MPVVRYQSPDDPAFVVFDKARFRVEHGLFYLRVESVRQKLAEVLEVHAGWHLEFMKLVEENRRVQACVEWLDALPGDTEQVHIPELVHEPAIDLVANALIAHQEYDRVDCPACLASYATNAVSLDPWEFEDQGVILRGRRTVCPKGHTIHVVTDLIEDLEVETEGD